MKRQSTSLLWVFMVVTAATTLSAQATVSQRQIAPRTSIGRSLRSPQTDPVGGTGNQFYVSPHGSASGLGTLRRPWDLATALAHPAAVRPGDTIWLRGGIYADSPVIYTSSLTGTTSAPIVVRQYPGEQATINGSILITGPYTWFWGFEVTNTSGARTDGQVLYGCVDTYPGSIGVKIINLTMHDCAQGIGLWVDAIDAEAYGNVIYYIGQAGPDRGHGHAIYTQNQTGTKHISDNVIFDGFDIGLQAYGTENAFVQNYDLNGNISFNNGVLYGSHVDNILFAVGSGLDNISVQNSYTYHTPSLDQGYSRLGWDFSGGNGSLVSKNNYWIGGQQSFEVWGFSNVTLTGNVSYSNGALMLRVGGGPSGTTGYSWDNNIYYGSGLLSNNNVGLAYSSWVQNSLLDTHSTFNPGRPTGIWSFVRPNKYEAGRANIVIYNWDLANTVSLDLSSVLKPGDSYAVRDVFNFYGPPATFGVFTGAPVSIPMTPSTVSQPIGYVPVAPKHTLPEFGTFVVTKN